MHITLLLRNPWAVDKFSSWFHRAWSLNETVAVEFQVAYYPPSLIGLTIDWRFGKHADHRGLEVDLELGGIGLHFVCHVRQWNDFGLYSKLWK